MKKRNDKKTIGKTKAAELITDSKGKFFTVTFMKKDNTMRTINCNYSKNQKKSALGYINVYSMKDKQYKNINMQTVKMLAINGITYKVN